ncbi:hypothetical protein [Escherichia coli]|uniref:hypothetical protein n=1 Tax=Escherichia coli TaxID=562 RepID=UPI001C7038DF|nr:hypothetical protein [Escherichia coli]MBW9584814.1 hypothetical protein [Escherichia coli]
MLAYIFKLFELFLKLPKPVQIQIINAIVATFDNVFKRFRSTKSKEDFKTATEETVTPQQWQGTSAAVSSFIPSLYSQKKKDEFANSVIQLVKSEGFLNELSKRINNIQTDDEESYVALCSVETKKLIIEMMDKK